MVTQTSLLAYEEVKLDGTIGKQASIIINYMNTFRGLTFNSRMLSKYLGLERSSVTGRLNELEKLGFIVESHKGVCPLTKKLTKFYQLK